MPNYSIARQVGRNEHLLPPANVPQIRTSRTYCRSHSSLLSMCVYHALTSKLNYEHYTQTSK